MVRVGSSRYLADLWEVRGAQTCALAVTSVSIATTRVIASIERNAVKDVRDVFVIGSVCYIV